MSASRISGMVQLAKTPPCHSETGFIGDDAAIRNDNPLEIFKLHHYLAGTKLSKGWEIR